MIETVRKVNLGRILDIMQKLYPDEYDFHPRSWFLPQQYGEFCDTLRHVHEKRRKPIYIIKPDEGSQGDGIYLIQEPKDYMFNNKHHIAQQYISNPLLIESLKFDFRVYVVLASLEPLEVYICKEGLTRFCTMPYQTPSNKNIHEAYMHLTNYSLNKHSINYLHTESEEDGSKRTMTSVFKQLDRMGYDIHRMWMDIEKVVVKTIIAIAPELKVEYRAELPAYKSAANMAVSCFQVRPYYKPYLAGILVHRISQK
jgi:tubulin polyglutamylase TTLL11